MKPFVYFYESSFFLRGVLTQYSMHIPSRKYDEPAGTSSGFKARTNQPARPAGERNGPNVPR